MGAAVVELRRREPAQLTLESLQSPFFSGVGLSRSLDYVTRNETKHYYASNAPNIEINMVQGQVLEDRVPGVLSVRGNGIGRAPRRETL